MRNILLLLTISSLLGCTPDKRTIDLESGLKRTSDGEFTLIAIGDEFVSFQRDGWHKYQYYYKAPLPETDMARIRAAVIEGQKKGFRIEITDANGSIESPAQ